MEGLIVPGIFGAMLAVAGLVLVVLEERAGRREQQNKSK